MVTRRQPRTPSPPARERLIRTAVTHIEREGMTVGLEHLSLERIIDESGVSRATAYRHFPRKSEFLTEVLTTVVRSTRLQGESPDEVADLLSLLAARHHTLGSPQGRRDLAVEALRRASRADFDRVATSPQWRTYLALHATSQGLPDGDLRREVLAALADTESRFTAHRAAVYTRLAALLGYRLVPPLAGPEGFAVMADATSALMTGLVVRSLTRPEDAAQTFRGAAHGSSEIAEWSWPAHHLVGLLLGHLEPDPDVVWDAAQLERSAASLTEMLQALADMSGQQAVLQATVDTSEPRFTTAPPAVRRSGGSRGRS